MLPSQIFDQNVRHIVEHEAARIGAKVVSFGRCWPDSPTFFVIMEKGNQRVTRRIVATVANGGYGICDYGGGEQLFTPEQVTPVMLN